jgi:hypothetical protein
MLELTSNVCNDGTRYNLRNSIEQRINHNRPAKTYMYDLRTAHDKEEVI